MLRNEGNRGKGYSVRRGMLAARGERRLMTDADLSTPIEELDRLMEKMDEGYDVAIASRALPESNVEVRQPWYRENSGPRSSTSACACSPCPACRTRSAASSSSGAEAAEQAFAPSRLDGFSFDVEALFIARRRGFRIAEVPVTWRNDAATRVGTFKGAVAFAGPGAHPLERLARGLRRSRAARPAIPGCSGSRRPAAAP